MTSRAASTKAVCNGLLDVAEPSRQHRRLFLRQHFGVQPADIFAELQPMLSEHITMQTSPGSAPLRIGAIRKGNVLLIPYLVDESAGAAAASSNNRGIRGYAGTLRTDFAEHAAPDDKHVLLVLDSEPFETILTAAEDAGELPELQWRKLVERVAAEAAGQGSALVKLVAEDLAGGHAGKDRGLLDELGRFAAYPWSSTAEAGRALPRFGCYLADPTPTLGRLQENAKWRKRLELFSMPDRSLRRELSALGGGDNHPGTARILAAYGPSGLDYNAFTFDDLPVQQEKVPFNAARPLQLRHMRGAVSAHDVCAVWLGTTDKTFTLATTGRPPAKKPTVTWHGGGGTGTCTLDESLMHVPVPAAQPETWVFGTIAIRPGTTIDVAVFRSDGSWFPIERSLQIDTQAACFRVLETPVIDAIGPHSQILGEAAAGQANDTEDRQEIWCSHAGTRMPITVMIESLGDPDPDPDPGEPGPPADPADPDDDPGDDPQSESPAGVASSAVHAVLRLAAERLRDGAEFDASVPTLSSPGSKSFIVDGSVRYDLETQMLAAGLDGLQAEAQIIEQGATGDVLAFTQVRHADGSTEVAADLMLNRLRLDGLDKPAVEEFWRARKQFLSAIRDAGTAHAVLCGIGTSEAERYISAYARLLQSASTSDSYRREFDRILLVDLLSSEDGTQCWLAPTNPVTVAWMLGLLGSLPELSTGELPERDIASITPRFLLPLFYTHGGWWEIDDKHTPLLWRCYRPLGSSVAQTGGNHRTILRRIDKFLRIFPAYDDPRQRLALAFREPGDGSSVAGALRKFYEREARPDAHPSRPGLDVTVYTQNGEVPEKLAELMAPDRTQDQDLLVQSRVTLTALPVNTEQGFSHICFAFRTPTARKPRDTAIAKRCPTSWVAGLASSVGRYAATSANELAFTSGLFLPPAGGEGTLTRLVQRTLELVGAQPDRMLRAGTTQATTTVLNHGDLDTVQRNSVWTVHADRLLGLEAFSHQFGDRKSYIVDFEDRTSAWQAGLDSVTVTERVDPYRTALGRAFLPYAHLADSALRALIDHANAVSGSWNLDMLNAPPNGLRERLGFLAAIAMLKDLDYAFGSPSHADGDLGGVLLPLDDMIGLLTKGGVSRPTGRACDDLIYLRLFRDGAAVRICARLMEVKFKTAGTPDIATARREVAGTRGMLQAVAASHGATRPFRARDLAEFIRSGAIRNRTFGLDSIDDGQLEDAAADIAAGNYTLSFAYTAGDTRLHGDVVSLELESTAPATRTVLDDGSAPPLGYVRLGQPAFEQLARHGALLRPSDWAPIRFLPGDHGPDPAEVPSPAPEPQPQPRSSAQPPGSSRQDGRTAEQPTVGAAEDIQPTGMPAATGAAQPTLPDRPEAELAAKAAELDQASAKYGLQLSPFDPALAQAGPSVLRFRTRPLGRESISNIRKRALDLGREVGFAEGLLIDQEPYYITVDVPRSEPVVVRLADHIHGVEDAHAHGALPFVLGMAPSGLVVIEDLARLPHLLVAGATGSGKSVLLRGLLCCLSRARSPEHLKIMIIDPKQVDFAPFRDLPHLVGSKIVTDPAEAVDLLAQTLEHEVAWRRRLLTDAGVTSALEYYEHGGSPAQLPQMAIIVDEFADLSASLDRAARDTFLSLIQRFGQLTRAFGIYLVLATQRPSVQVVTGDIKANLTARVALKVQSAADSMTILGHGGAESLRSGGDLIFDHGGRTQRLQALFAGPADIREAKAFWANH